MVGSAQLRKAFCGKAFPVAVEVMLQWSWVLPNICAIRTASSMRVHRARLCLIRWPLSAESGRNLRSLASSPSPCDHRYTVRSNVCVLDRIVSRTENGVCRRLLFKWRFVPAKCLPSNSTATQCNTEQHTATHCNILQHTVMYAYQSTLCVSNWTTNSMPSLFVWLGVHTLHPAYPAYSLCPWYILWGGFGE